MIPLGERPARAHFCKPRACGDDPHALENESRQPLVNPARAGMILTAIIALIITVGKPRACGDDPATEGSGYTDPG